MQYWPAKPSDSTWPCIFIWGRSPMLVSSTGLSNRTKQILSENHKEIEKQVSHQHYLDFWKSNLNPAGNRSKAVTYWATLSNLSLLSSSPHSKSPALLIIDFWYRKVHLWLYLFFFVNKQISNLWRIRPIRWEY